MKMDLIAEILYGQERLAPYLLVGTPVWLLLAGAAFHYNFLLPVITPILFFVSVEWWLALLVRMPKNAPEIFGITLGATIVVTIVSLGLIIKTIKGGWDIIQE
jgi:Sec-independent protein secretion pathway component TatC